MHSIPKETSWIKTKAFAWSTKQRYSATFSTFCLLICLTWFVALRPLHVRHKKALLLDQECQALEHEIRIIEKRRTSIKERVPLSKLQSLSVYALLARLNYLLETAGITLESYSTYQRKKASPPIFKLITTGSFDAFLHFLTLLKEEALTLRLKNIKFTRLYHMRLKALIELQTLSPLQTYGAQA